MTAGQSGAIRGVTVTPATKFDLDRSHQEGQRLRMALILSIFPGADLLGRGFEQEGFCVVRGPDLVWGGDIRTFHPPANKFAGVIGGSPCQEFSRERRAQPITGEGVALLGQFARVVMESRAPWFLLENVAGVPAVDVPGYTVQRFNLRATECGGRQLRLRVFQFGSRDGVALTLARAVTAAADIASPELVILPAALASEGRRAGRLGFADFCELQGLPRDFNLPGLSLGAKYRAVGNGVPVYVARVVAQAIAKRGRGKTVRLCPCMCGRPLSGRAKSAGPACRKRLERTRRQCDRVPTRTAGGVTVAL